MTKTLKILAPTRYPWLFNGPRQSRHTIIRKNFVPMNYVSKRLEGVTVFPHVPFERFDLIHGFNRIPIGRKPYIIGFESHLPRGFGIESSALFSVMRRSLASNRCRAIVAISDWARRMFLMQHERSAEQDDLASKLLTRHPSIVVPTRPPAALPIEGPIKLFFVGNHFARKGGCVALRIAEIARRRSLPIKLDIVSNLEVGPMSWTDPSDPSFFDRYRPTLALDNVTYSRSLPNEKVLSRLKSAHFVLLPTFGDTFGYSVIEGFMYGKPVIATDQCALPEFVEDGLNGYLLPLEKSEKSEWVLLGRPDRGSDQFVRRHAETVDQLAEKAITRLETLLNEPQLYPMMAMAAYDTVLRKFDARNRNIFWDDLYEVASGNRKPDLDRFRDKDDHRSHFEAFTNR